SVPFLFSLLSGASAGVARAGEEKRHPQRCRPSRSPSIVVPAASSAGRGPAPRARSVLAKRRPEKSTELARHRRDRLVVRLAVRDQPPVSAVEPRLGAIGERDHPARLPLASLAQLLPDAGLVPIVPRRLNEQPPRMLVP